MSCFIAIDVETANFDQGSICQIGLVCFNNGTIEWEWSSLTDPEDEFDATNIRIHRITPDQVAGAAKWPQIVEHIADALRAQTIVSHSLFDQNALIRASARYELQLPDFRWIDSRAVAHQAWPQLGKYGLSDLCKVLGIELEHHNALSDAKACGHVLVAGLRSSGLTLEQLASQRSESLSPARAHAQRNRQSPKHQEDHVASAALDGPLRGEVAVLTGSFKDGKRPLAELAASAGCHIDDNFRKSRTTILVVGRRDPADWNGVEKSGKHRRAEEAIAEGHRIEILTEEQFRHLLEFAVSTPPFKAAI